MTPQQPPTDADLNPPATFLPQLRPALRQRLWARHCVKHLVKRIRTKSRMMNGVKQTVRVAKAERHWLKNKMTCVWWHINDSAHGAYLFRKRQGLRKSAQWKKVEKRLNSYPDDESGVTTFVS